MASVVSPDTNQDLQTSSRDPIHSSPVRSLVSRFEKKQEQNLDALPFRTVRNFFDGDDERSIHVTTEKQKYDTLMAKQRAEAEARRLQRSPEISIARKRIPSNAIQNPEEHIHVPMNPKEENNPAEDEEEEEEEEETALPSLARKLELEFDDEVDHPQTIPEDEEVPNSIEEAVDIPPPPPPPPMEEETVLERKEFVNTPEQETKKRPMLTTERSFVMEEDHTIETEDLIVVCERFSTDGEEDREMLMEMLERQLHLVPQDEEELRRAMQANPSKARVLRRAYKYKRPENVPSKLFAPTAASLASRTTKSPSAVKKTTPTGPPAPSPSLGTTTPARRKSNKYANVQSKVKEMMKPSSPDDKTPTKAHRRRASDASDVSHTSSRSSMGGTSTPLRSTRTSQQNGASSADRRSFMSNRSSRRSSVNRTILDLHGDDGHSEWEGRHRSERLSFGSTSSTDSTDPFALQQSFLNRKSRYDTVQPRYLDYNKQSATYQRNKEAQQERRRKLEEANAAKSAERQKQLQYQLKLKEKREKEDLEQAVRRGEELHKMTQLLKEKEKVEDTERRKSQSMIRRALSGTGSVDTPSVGRRGGSTGSSVGASSPRTSLLSEPDSIPSSATSGARSNPVTAA